MSEQPRKLKLSRRVLIGLAFIYIAGIGWAAELVIPFLDLDRKAAIWVGVLILAEISFLIGVAILGKPVYQDLKARFISALKSRNRQ